jgi:hypothetical protein
MSATWGRVLVGIAVVACLLGLGALEVLSQRVRVDPVATTGVRSEGVGPEPSGDALALQHDDLLGLEPSNGEIQRIVVLRAAWRKMTSPEQ